MPIKRHPDFKKWFDSIVDIPTRNRIAAGIAKLPFGLGTVKRLTGSKVSELVINYGPGFRVYFVTRGATVIILLAGGKKGSQKRDIAAAEAREQNV